MINADKDRKTGVFICSGCEIEQRIDIESIASEVTAAPEISCCERHHAWCSAEGITAIRKSISDNQLSEVVLAACSPRVMQDQFRFLDEYEQDGKRLVSDRVNLREQVAWSHKVDDDTNDLARDLIMMGVARVQSISRPEPYIEPGLSSRILVIGGGITGMTCAGEGAKAGYQVTLVEKESTLGGWIKRFTNPFNDLPDITNLIKELESDEKLEILTSTRIKSVSGQPGQFEVVLESEKSEPKQLIAGAIILANGWKPYPAEKLTGYSYSDHEQVITQVELEQILASEKKLPLLTGHPENIVFLQCAGSRDPDHLPYCSNVCCEVSLKQALLLREAYPDARVYILYKDIRTSGMAELTYHKVQKDSRIFMTKGDFEQIQSENGKLYVHASNTLLGPQIRIPGDLIVLATGMIPAATDDLNLQYRQGPGLPELKYQFSDSHFICFPYETRRTGIYAAGAIRAPMDADSCLEDAGGATLKAIQCIESVKKGKAVHPRSWDLSYPELYLQRCTDCKRCTEECPFGSYDENEKGTPLPHLNRCRRCGICMGSCPERIINFEDFSIHSVSAMIKSVSMPDEFEEKPRILAFVCENDAYPAFDMAGVKRLTYSPYVRIIPVRCIGSVNKVWISDALSHGYDGILQIGCKPGDDYQCHSITGSELTRTRSENIQETLQTMMLETERIRTEFLEIDEYNRIPEIIEDYMNEIELIGPNPFKGM